MKKVGGNCTHRNQPNKILAVTRPAGRGSDTADFIRELGLDPLIVHTVELKARNRSDVFSDLSKIISEGSIDWIVFMSPEGVQLVFDVLTTHGNLLPGLVGSFRIVAVGPMTREALLKQGLSEVDMPQHYSSEGVASFLAQSSLDGKRILLVRSSDANDILDRTLSSRGAITVTIPVYSSSQPEDTSTVKFLVEQLQKKMVAAVLFTSSRSVSNLFEITEQEIGSRKLAQFLRGCLVGAIGPVTAKTLLDFGIKPDVLPQHSLINEATKLLAEAWEAQNTSQIIPST